LDGLFRHGSFPNAFKEKKKRKKKKKKGHAQQLRRSQRNPRSNAKTIGAQTTADGEFVFSESVKASNDRASPDCRSRIRTEFDRLGRTATSIEFFRSV
jgi:hypothetical protein